MAYYPTVQPIVNNEYVNNLPVTDSVLSSLRECGFNLALGSPLRWAFPMTSVLPDFYFCPELPGTISSPAKFLENLETYRVIDYIKESTVNGETVQTKMARNENFKMLGFQDEPNFNDKDKKVLQNLRENYREVRRMGLPQLPYLNVAVNGKATNYDDKDTAANNLNRYLDEIQENLLPAMWCYDYYPVYCHFALREKYRSIEDDGAQEDLQDISSLKATGKIYANRHTFLWLEIFSLKAKQTGRPFWYVGLSREFQTLLYNEIKEKDGTKRSEPTYILRRYANETTMRFAAFSALAYGAKGLAWWSYAATVGLSGGPSDSSGKTTYCFNAPCCLVKKDDGKDETRQTELWNQLKKVNEEVQSFKDIFLKTGNHVVYHTGRYIYNNNDLPWPGVTEFPGAKDAVLDLVTDEMGVLISFFSIGSQRYVMLVNHDIENPQDICIDWDLKRNVSLIGAAPESKKKANSEKNTHSQHPIEVLQSHKTPALKHDAYKCYILEPGGYLIFNYRQAPPPPDPNPYPDPNPDNPVPPPPVPPVIPPAEEEQAQ